MVANNNYLGLCAQFTAKVNATENEIFLILIMLHIQYSTKIFHTVTSLRKKEQLKMKKPHKEKVCPAQKGHHRLGLQAKMMLGLLGSLILVLSITGMILARRAQKELLRLMNMDITNQAENIRSNVDGYLDGIIKSLCVISDMDNVQSLVMEADAADANFRFENSERFPITAKELKAAHENLPENTKGLFVSCAKNNENIRSNGTTSEPGYMLTERPWWKMLEASNGQPIVSGAYEDAASSSMVVTIAVPIMNGSNLIGAVAADVTLDAVFEMLSQIHLGETGYPVVCDGENNIIYHPNNDLILSNIADTKYSDIMKNAIVNNQDLQGVTYTYANTSYQGTLLPSTFGWKILGCMPSEEFGAEVQHFIQIIIVCFAFIAILLSIVSIINIKSMLRPIMRLERVADKLAQGDLDVQVDVSSNDEIGDLARSISRIVDSLKTHIAYIEEISEVLEEMGQRNMVFELKQNYVGEFSKLKTAINDIQSSLSKTIFGILNIAEQVDESSSSMSSGAQSLAQGATEQASTVQELAASIQILASHSTKEADMAKQTSQDVANIGNKVKESNHDMKNMLTAMDNISDRSSEIAKIVKTVEDIAFQTNILALNAAVEAARAGEAGKGFAVVADEVRSLASKSGEAAKDITQLIQDTISAVNDGVQIAGVTASSLDEVAAQMDTVVTAIDHIAEIYRQESGQMQEITTSIDQVSSVIQSNSATSEESAATAEELASQVELMKNMVDSFQLDEKYHE